MTFYNRAANTLSLLNSAGTAWTTAALGSAGTLQNNQCIVTLGGSSSAVTAGNMLTLNVAMTFKPAFAGARSVILYATNTAGMNSGFQIRGSWTVP